MLRHHWPAETLYPVYKKHLAWKIYLVLKNQFAGLQPFCSQIFLLLQNANLGGSAHIPPIVGA